MGRKAVVNPKNARSYGVYLTEEQRIRIEILAFLKKTTRSDLIRDLVQVALDQHKVQIDAIIAARDQINAKEPS